MTPHTTQKADPMPTGDPAPELDSEAVAAVITEFLGQFTDDQLEVAEEAGIKLNRLLLGFLEAEVLPQAMRAAELGVDPTPILAVVTGVLRIYADALERPDTP
ncbi:MAG TPA: hypothetical protein VK736_04580 [Candidatus Binatia bacterium]|nr:hypothetical protein [Candidatus Binatia bacterium]